MGATGDKVSNLKLKIKIGNKRIEAGPVTHLSDFGQDFSMCNRVKPSQPNAKKRVAPQNLEGQKVKRLKMDQSLKQQCSGILKKLMTHPAGWVFLVPVDPVQLKIPDYFSIITDPMDLGTVKSRLDRDAYLNVEEFAADVRLTFSNAMVYNPSYDAVHGMAKELSYIFEARWKAVEANMNRESSKVGLKQVPCGRIHETNSLKKTGRQISDLSSGFPLSEYDFLSKNTTESHISRSDQDTDGAASCLDEEHSSPVSHLTSHATYGSSAKGCDTPVLDVQLSPKRALRAAMLRCRFADTILKAQQKTFLVHGDKVNPVKMQLLKRKQLEEKVKIESQIKAAQALLKAQDELKQQIGTKRKAARLALEQLEKNVEIEDNLKSLKDLAVLSGFSASICHISCRDLSDLVSRKWGLSIKEDDFVDEVEYEEREEGEILEYD